VGLSAAYGFLQTDRGFVGLSSYERKMITKVDAFTASGTFTPPAGATYAVAHIQAGGGGVGLSGAGAGGTSSVAFNGGTISATGGNAYNVGNLNLSGGARAGATNSGQGAVVFQSEIGLSGTLIGGNGALIVAGGAVTAGTGIAVTVGAGGTAGTNGAAGGGGYVWIEYQVSL